MKKNCIETYTGKKIDLLNPKSTDIDIKDIARGLAMTVRFGGHLEGFMSVAQHSFNVANLLHLDPFHVQMYGLLHDAPEAYLGDVVRPLKYMLPLYHRMEKNMMKAILRGLGLHKKLVLTKKQLQVVKEADNGMLILERHDLKSKCVRKNGWTNYNKYHGGYKPMSIFGVFDTLECWDWQNAERNFLSKFKLLNAAI